MRFLDNRQGSKYPTASILTEGVDFALQQAGFDQQRYLHRDGDYWKRLAPKQQVPDIEDIIGHGR